MKRHYINLKSQWRFVLLYKYVSLEERLLHNCNMCTDLNRITEKSWSHMSFTWIRSQISGTISPLETAVSSRGHSRIEFVFFTWIRSEVSGRIGAMISFCLPLNRCFFVPLEPILITLLDMAEQKKATKQDRQLYETMVNEEAEHVEEERKQEVR